MIRRRGMPGSGVPRPERVTSAQPNPDHSVSNLNRNSMLRRLVGLLFLGMTLPILSCMAPSHTAEMTGELTRARVELASGLYHVHVDAALLDTSGTLLRAQVDLSTSSNISRKVRGYFQWKDAAGIDLGGRAEQTKSIRGGRAISFTSFAPSPEAFQYVFHARGG